MKSRGLFGIELRNIKISIGVEHEEITADIFYSNKKIGEICNDGWCEETYTEFINNKCEKIFKNILEKHNISSEKLIDEILFLNNQYRWVKNDTHYQLVFLK